MTSNQYFKVKQHVLSPTRDSRKELDTSVLDKFPKKPESVQRKKRAIELLDKYDQWIESRKPKPKKDPDDEKLIKLLGQKRAELNSQSGSTTSRDTAASGTSSGTSSSSGMAFKGDEFVRKIYGILRSAGLTGIEIARFFVKNGLTLTKNVVTPIHHSVQKHRRRTIKRRNRPLIYKTALRRIGGGDIEKSNRKTRKWRH